MSSWQCGKWNGSHGRVSLQNWRLAAPMHSWKNLEIWFCQGYLWWIHIHTMVSHDSILRLVPWVGIVPVHWVLQVFLCPAQKAWHKVWPFFNRQCRKWGLLQPLKKVVFLFSGLKLHHFQKAQDHSQINSGVRDTKYSTCTKFSVNVCNVVESFFKKSKIAQILMKSALDYCTILAAFPIPEFM